MTTILIIEDNSEIQNILAGVFYRYHQVIPAFSGTEGLRIFSEQKVDLVLLDIMLPGKTGDQVLKEIREKSQVPVIILTALGDKRRISEYLLAGANDYITKPFDLDELAARVKVQLRGKSEFAEQEECLSVKNIRLDPKDYSISSAEHQVQLTAKEYEILLTLMKNPRQIFTKEQLYEKVWHEIYLPGDNTINTHLSNLRKKIASLDSDNEYIETIWGLGVRIRK